MSRKSQSPNLSEVQKNQLLTIVKCRDSAQHLVQRVHIVLLAADGQANNHIAPQVKLCQETVRTWRKRWNNQQAKIEADGNEKARHNSSGDHSITFVRKR